MPRAALPSWIAGRPRPLVLVAADDVGLRSYLAASIARDGAMDAVEAADGREALVLARALRPDLVVSDLAAGGFDGVALCRALRAADATRSIPILAVSGARQPRPCADTVLAKPYNAATLRTAVSGLLSRPLSVSYPSGP